MKKTRPFVSKLIDQTIFLKALIIILIIFLAIALKNNSKPPQFIYYSKDKAITLSQEVSSSVSKEHIELFLEHFIRFHNFHDAFALEENLTQAVNMMTSEQRNHYMTKIINSNLLSEIKEKKLKTRTSIIRMEYDNTLDVIPATVIFKRELISFDDKPIDSLLIRSELILTKEPVTESCKYLLRVDKNREVSLNES